jgi:hypothetical protein
MVVGIWPVLLAGAYGISKRKEKIAAEEQADAVREAIDKTKADADNAMKTALDKAAKDKAAAVDREVKKAVAEAQKSFDDKLAAMQAPAEAEDTDAGKSPEEEA